MTTSQIAFSINASTLNNALSKVIGVINKTAISEYLSCVKLKINDGKLVIEATNMDCVISACDDTVSNAKDGSICVDAHSLSDIVKKLPKDQNIDFSMEANKDNLSYLLIRSGKSKFDLATLDAENYPKTLVTIKDQTITIENEDLLFLIDKTEKCIYQNETRYNINGMLLNFDKDNGKIFAVSTHVHALAHAFVESKGISQNQKVTIPRKMVLELQKILRSEKGIATIDVSNSKVTFNFTNSSLTTKLIDAEFPDYNRVIPKDYIDYFSVNTKNFFNAIDRVSSIYSGATTEIGVKLKVTQDSIKIQSIKDINKGFDELPSTFTRENEMQIMCNFLYLKEILNLINSPDVNIFVKDSNFPMIIKDSETDSFFYVLMPMKI
jgi:DNA polymerase-3 subunit beta